MNDWLRLTAYATHTRKLAFACAAIRPHQSLKDYAVMRAHANYRVLEGTGLPVPSNFLSIFWKK